MPVRGVGDRVVDDAADQDAVAVLHDHVVSPRGAECRRVVVAKRGDRSGGSGTGTHVLGGLQVHQPFRVHLRQDREDLPRCRGTGPR